MTVTRSGYPTDRDHAEPPPLLRTVALSGVATRLAASWERARASLFVVPMMFVLGGVALGAVMLAIDGRFADASGLPLVLQPTVDSARAVLTTVAGATVTVAGIA